MLVDIENVSPWSGGVKDKLVRRTVSLCKALNLNPITSHEVVCILEYSRIIIDEPQYIKNDKEENIENPEYECLFDIANGRGTIPMRNQMLKVIEVIKKLEKDPEQKQLLHKHSIPPEKPALFVLVLLSISESLLRDKSLSIDSYAVIYNMYSEIMQPTEKIHPINTKEISDIHRKVLDLYWHFPTHNLDSATHDKPKPMLLAGPYRCKTPPYLPIKRPQSALNETDTNSIKKNSTLNLTI